MKTKWICSLFTALWLAVPATVPAEIPADIQSLIKTIAERYEGIQSLRQESEWTIQLEKDGESEEIKNASSLSFQRPDRLKVISEHAIVLSDGKNLSVVFPAFEAYILNAIESNLEATIADFDQNLGVVITPDLRALISADPVASLTALVEDSPVTLLGDETVGDRKAWHMSVETDPAEAQGLDDVEVWVDQETGLLLQLTARIDMAALLGSDAEKAANVPSHIQVKYTAKLLALNEPLNDDVFAMDLSASKQLADFDALREYVATLQAGQQNNTEWVGKQAADFELPLLDGETFKLADHRGKVVLIDFWATWCPPCMESIPYVVKMDEAFDDDDVVFVGVSLDRPGQEKRVQQIMDRFKMTYAIGIDDGGAIAQQYGASSIPTAVLVDRDGTILEWKVGFSPEGMEMLKKTIEQSIAK